TGSVTSTVSLVRRASSEASLSASLRVASAAVTRSFSALINAPWLLRSSALMPPSVRSSAETEPVLPSAPTRTASSAGSSAAWATAARISCSIAFRSAIASLRHQWQVGVARPAAGLREHAVYLAAMMGLVIEEMRHQGPDRVAHLPVGGEREPGEVAGKPSRLKLAGPGDDGVVEFRALALERLPVG